MLKLERDTNFNQKAWVIHYDGSPICVVLSDDDFVDSRELLDAYSEQIDIDRSKLTCYYMHFNILNLKRVKE